MFRENTKVLENKKVAPGHYVLTLGSAKIAQNAKPGQFVQILCSNSPDPLLPRPFSFLTASGHSFSVLYQVVGKGTELLSLVKKGDKLRVVGPLGNGFLEGRGKREEVRGKTVILIGGGVGIPPLYHFAQDLLKRHGVDKNKIHVFLGAREKSLLLCEKNFKKLGIKLHISTNDGSKGSKGFITQLLDDFLHLSPLTSHLSPLLFTCGPTPMLKAVSVIAQKYKVPCEVSVEEPMACGFGACLGCAIKVANPKDLSSPRRRGSADSRIRGNDSFRFAMACTEGPVFPAKDILWD